YFETRPTTKHPLSPSTTLFRSESRPFRDTSYLPSIFWKWEPEDKAFIDRMRLGLEHESNGSGGERSRSINTVFVRPGWHKSFEKDRKSTRLNSSHEWTSYAVFC